MKPHEIIERATPAGDVVLITKLIDGRTFYVIGPAHSNVRGSIARDEIDKMLRWDLDKALRQRATERETIRP
jgi:hypothetical protein